MKRTIRSIVLSWDLLVAIAAAVAAGFLMPGYLQSSFCRDAYFAGLTVLAIIFAIFLAAISIIMASTDDNFVTFLEKEVDGSYSVLIGTFRITLTILFVSLLVSLGLYLYTSFQLAEGTLSQTRSYFLVFVFSGAYALFAVCMSCGDTITYSKYRTKFLLRDDKDQSV